MVCSILKILKTAFLYTPFYNLYGSIYLEQEKIVAVQTTYTNKFGYNNFIVTNNDNNNCFRRLNQEYKEISIKKYHQKNGNTYIINDNEEFLSMMPYNISELINHYKINQDKFKISSYNLYNIEPNMYGSMTKKPNKKHNKKQEIEYNYSYLKCTKSHLHLSRNLWPSSKFLGRIKNNDINDIISNKNLNIVSICMNRCIRRGYKNYFSIDSGNICWCSKKEPNIKDISNKQCMKCYDDSSVTCGNVNYGFMSVYKINKYYTYSVTKARRPLYQNETNLNSKILNTTLNNLHNSTVNNLKNSTVNNLKNSTVNNLHNSTLNNLKNSTVNNVKNNTINIIGISNNFSKKTYNINNTDTKYIPLISLRINNTHNNINNNTHNNTHNNINNNTHNNTHNNINNNKHNNIHNTHNNTTYFSSVKVKIFETKLAKILNVIDRKMEINQTKEEIVDIWNNFDENWDDDDDLEDD